MLSWQPTLSASPAHTRSPPPPPHLSSWWRSHREVSESACRSRHDTALFAPHHHHLSSPFNLRPGCSKHSLGYVSPQHTFPRSQTPQGNLISPLTGNIFHFSPEPKRLSVPRLRVSRPESQKNQRKTNRRVGGGGIEEPSFCHLDNLVCKPFGMSLLQQVYSG